jgi:hypothetical protein
VAGAALWSGRGQTPRPVVEEGDQATTGAALPKTGDLMGSVSRLAARHDQLAVNELIQIYGRGASDTPEALEARRMALQALLAHPNVEVGLQAVLSAVAMDQTPKRQDPMWPHLVRGVASLWNAVTITRGRDLVMIEKRAKPREVLLESLAEVRPETLTDEQRAQLVADLIDLYPSLQPEQKPAVDRALTALGSSDLVEILGGRGLGQQSHLKAAVEEKRQLEAASRTLRPPN